MTLLTQSAIPDFAPALMRLWAAVPALKGVYVCDGPPTPGTALQPEIVMLGDVTDWSVEPRALNRTNQPRREEFRQNVLISVLQQTRADQATVNDRAWDIFRLLEAAIRTDPSISSAWTADGQIVHVLVEGGEFLKRANDTSREASIEFRLYVLARI